MGFVITRRNIKVFFFEARVKTLKICCDPYLARDLLYLCMSTKNQSISWLFPFKVQENGHLYRMKRPRRRLAARERILCAFLLMEAGCWIGISPRMCYNSAGSSVLTTVFKVINKPHLNKEVKRPTVQYSYSILPLYNRRL